MPQPIYTTGSWKPFPGHEDAFLAAWEEFMSWATGLPGAGEAVLARDEREPGRFVSFAAWESIDAVRRWKASPSSSPAWAACRSTSTSSRPPSSMSLCRSSLVTPSGEDDLPAGGHLVELADGDDVFDLRRRSRPWSA